VQPGYQTHPKTLGELEMIEIGSQIIFPGHIVSVLAVKKRKSK
jgi:hypothetical protein